MLFHNKRIAFLFLPVFPVLVAGCITVSRGINVTNPDFLNEVGVKRDFNPHKGDNCPVCHRAPAHILKSSGQSKKEASAKRSMRTDLVRLCDDCHEASKWPHHLTGIKPKSNVSDLPLDGKGLITCATTCHNVHTVDPVLSRGKLADSFDNLCLSCHGRSANE